MNDAITVERAGEILGCSRRRVFQLLADGTLERAPRYGRRVRVYLASVEAALAPPKRRNATKRRASRAGFALAEVPL